MGAGQVGFGSKCQVRFYPPTAQGLCSHHPGVTGVITPPGLGSEGQVLPGRAGPHKACGPKQAPGGCGGRYQRLCRTWDQGVKSLGAGVGGWGQAEAPAAPGTGCAWGFWLEARDSQGPCTPLCTPQLPGYSSCAHVGTHWPCAHLRQTNTPAHTCDFHSSPHRDTHTHGACSAGSEACAVWGTGPRGVGGLVSPRSASQPLAGQGMASCSNLGSLPT